MLTDGRTDDERKVITIAHPEQSSGELKMKKLSCSQAFSHSKPTDLSVAIATKVLKQFP